MVMEIDRSVRSEDLTQLKFRQVLRPDGFTRRQMGLRPDGFTRRQMGLRLDGSTRRQMGLRPDGKMRK